MHTRESGTNQHETVAQEVEYTQYTDNADATRAEKDQTAQEGSDNHPHAVEQA